MNILGLLQNTVYISWNMIASSFLMLCCSLTSHKVRAHDSPHAVLNIIALWEGNKKNSTIFKAKFTSIPNCSLVADLKMDMETQGKQVVTKHQKHPWWLTASPLAQVTHRGQQQTISTVLLPLGMKNQHRFHQHFVYWCIVALAFFYSCLRTSDTDEDEKEEEEDQEE